MSNITTPLATADVVQSLPTGDGHDVGAHVCALLRAQNLDGVADDLEARIRFGEKKYGTRLKTNNGRDALLDAYQEILDGVNYSAQFWLENGDDGDLCHRFIELAAIIHNMRQRTAAKNEEPHGKV